MANTNYELRYLLLFYRDLEEKIVYIERGVLLVGGARPLFASI